ncbi:hypothetical protein JT55_04850 [Rhodovulum sp. NI22]|nr:hypothetical protein JT55_04850 [Rhodovulum sp. NI22]
MKTTTSLAALALVAAGPALAGNLEPTPVEPVVATPVPVVAVGRDWTGGYAGLQLGYGNLDAGGALDEDGDGAIGGVHAGYDYDFGRYVLGVGVDYEATDISLGGGAGDLDSLARLKLRGGIDLGQTLVYGTGGAAYADAIGNEDTGYFVGIGAERMIRENVSLGGEVLYHKFDDFDDTDVDLEATTVAARLSFKF